MTPMQFDSFWLSNYAGSVPLPHLFKHDFRNRWFRIFNFPEKRRNSIKKADWEELLIVQNEIITDLIGNKSSMWGITGEYGLVDDFSNPEFFTKGLLHKFTFTELNPIDMHKFSPAEFKIGEIYRSFITELTWQPNKYNDLLKGIAIDTTRMFFICHSAKCIIAPFDGGIDFILENSLVRNTYEKKYKNWKTSKLQGI